MEFRLDEPLPLCDGPKLKPFAYTGAPVDFVDLLSADSPGEHSHVFEVVINSQHFALKVVSMTAPVIQTENCHITDNSGLV